MDGIHKTAETLPCQCRCGVYVQSSAVWNLTDGSTLFFQWKLPLSANTAWLLFHSIISFRPHSSASWAAQLCALLLSWTTSLRLTPTANCRFPCLEHLVLVHVSFDIEDTHLFSASNCICSWNVSRSEVLAQHSYCSLSHILSRGSLAPNSHGAENVDPVPTLENMQGKVHAFVQNMTWGALHAAACFIILLCSFTIRLPSHRHQTDNTH